MPLSPLVSHGKRVISDILGAAVEAGPVVGDKRGSLHAGGLYG